MTTAFDKTYLAVDYGERRIGLAKSDPTGLIASALETLVVRSDKEALAALEKVLAEVTPDALVVGYPLHASGEKSLKCEAVDRFISKLRQIYDGPIHRVDERYSSEEAAAIIHAHGKKKGKDKGRIDRLAAAIILQRFLDESGLGERVD
jgi:putative Holliday junction resolvase